MKYPVRIPVTAAMVVLLASFLLSCGELPEVAAVGKPAPDFVLLDRQSRTWSLADLRGQVVFLNFWATWCPPCREEMPAMQTLYQSMPPDRFKMLAILYKDEPPLADAFAVEIGFTFPILIDPDTRIGRAYGLTGVPETFIIDKEGVLREKYIGPRPWNSPAIRQMVMRYIAE